MERDKILIFQENSVHHSNSSIARLMEYGRPEKLTTNEPHSTITSQYGLY